mmetsp:Transcript_41591/g.47267  ORF Transcript_41591/g.47267 Transcript_41591/m.47267 type:complete len:394 (-) Transcript_41591:220-1401(-)|eukprot:CAMPEP_0194153030 /NCGR_PEP_ID=MMETSP0152-20130528/55026_1 /TAXON_ID=1049557 /ORGANISM="Thalassiothrix antarctica, Strain L6-D1" /LENGTH=393 /DNA_ID=CAMNT_0038858065 /DNA_START=210 /DNA_END=1391 /DNA_ORIENTATION=+
MKANHASFIAVLFFFADKTSAFYTSSSVAVSLIKCQPTPRGRITDQFRTNYHTKKDFCCKSNIRLSTQSEDTTSNSSSSKSIDKSQKNNENISPPTIMESIEEPSVTLTGGEDTIYRQAIKRTLVWVSLAGGFGLLLWYFIGPATAEEFYAGYIVEQSLSVDNLFVFLLLFDFFQVPIQLQDKVLTWGIYGSVVMRATMITIGAFAIGTFRPVLLIFASILVYSSAKILMDGDDDEEEDMSDNAIVKFSRRLIDSTENFDGNNFFTIVDGVRKATPLFLCMIAIEISDVVFAVDSIPAVFGVTENTLVVFSSNMFAIMGLRSLYTILSKAATDLIYLEPAVAVVLGFIGSKLIGEYFGYEIPTVLSLTIVASLLGTGIIASVVEKKRKEEQET